MGHMSLELAEAAATEGPCSPIATRDVRSSASDDMGVVEVCELKDTELSDGESRLAFRECCGLAAVAGDNDLPLPKILPPPSDLRAAILFL